MTTLSIITLSLTVSCWKLGIKWYGRVGLLEGILFNCLENSTTVFLRIFQGFAGCHIPELKCGKHSFRCHVDLFCNLEKWENVSFYLTLISIFSWLIVSVTCTCSLYYFLWYAYASNNCCAWQNHIFSFFCLALIYSLNILVFFCCTSDGKDFEKVTCYHWWWAQKNVVLEEESWFFPINVGA